MFKIDWFREAGEAGQPASIDHYHHNRLHYASRKTLDKDGGFTFGMDSEGLGADSPQMSWSAKQLKDFLRDGVGRLSGTHQKVRPAIMAGMSRSLPSRGKLLFFFFFYSFTER